MLSKNNIKHITALSMKKRRDAERLFVAEGEKLVDELLEHFQCELLVATDDYLSGKTVVRSNTIIKANAEELKKITQLKTPASVIGVFKQPEYTFEPNVLDTNLVIALDDIQDPGNLGTIIRIADWFGINDIICSPHSADVYNSKTIQATMGAIARVRTHYMELTPLLQHCKKKNIPLYGTFLDGKNIYTDTLTPNGLIIMGNEGKGISTELQPLISHRLFIPNFPINAKTSESLNVAVATAITCSEFRRRMF
ncbi:MAG TPA: RNA methyltransferase [Paludibacteraceae bacterium]|nr:RNA methyltransferase [Paludibacteraceae bacterium]